MTALDHRYRRRRQRDDDFEARIAEALDLLPAYLRTPTTSREASMAELDLLPPSVLALLREDDDQ